jgi:hypothetical protein
MGVRIGTTSRLRRRTMAAQFNIMLRTCTPRICGGRLGAAA